eukprot:15462995-Alexandrium_andersonii.AAC.1
MVLSGFSGFRGLSVPRDACTCAPGRRAAYPHPAPQPSHPFSAPPDAHLGHVRGDGTPPAP